MKTVFWHMGVSLILLLTAALSVCAVGGPVVVVAHGLEGIHELSTLLFNILILIDLGALPELWLLESSS